MNMINCPGGHEIRRSAGEGQCRAVDEGGPDPVVHARTIVLQPIASRLMTSPHWELSVVLPDNSHQLDHFKNSLLPFRIDRDNLAFASRPRCDRAMLWVW